MGKKTISVTLEASRVAELKNASKQNGVPVSAFVRLAIGDFLPKADPLVPEAVDEVKGYLIRCLDFKQRSAGLKNVAVKEACDEFSRLILEFQPTSAVELEQSIDNFLKSATELAAAMPEERGAV